MKTIVIYKSKYGSTKQYAFWIAEALGCEAKDAKTVKASDLAQYDTIVYGGGLYSQMIAGIHLLTKNMDALKDKRIYVFFTGITPLSCADYYQNMVPKANFKHGVPENVKLYYFLGKMILDELSVPHRAAIKMLKKIMGGKQNPTQMEKMLIDLCDVNVDLTDINQIKPLLKDIKNI